MPTKNQAPQKEYRVRLLKPVQIELRAPNGNAIGSKWIPYEPEKGLKVEKVAEFLAREWLARGICEMIDELPEVAVE